MKKSFIAFAVLVIVVAGAAAAAYWARQDDRRAVVVSWARSLIWQNLKTPSAPRLEKVEVSRAGPEEGGNWMLTGELVLPDKALPEPFSAAIDQSCGDPKREACWALARLEIGGEAIAIAKAAEGEGERPEPDPYAELLEQSASDLDELPAALREEALEQGSTEAAAIEAAGESPVDPAGPSPDAAAAEAAETLAAAEPPAAGDPQAAGEPAPMQPEVAEAASEVVVPPGMPPIPRRNPSR